jgi:hypothetical protein
MTRLQADKGFSSRCRSAYVATPVRGQADDRDARPRGRIRVVVRLRLQAIGCEGSPARGLVAPVDYHERKRSSGQ